MFEKLLLRLTRRLPRFSRPERCFVDLDESDLVLKPRRGRPKGSTNAAKAAAVKIVKPVARKRNLSPEGRKRIAEAMKRRWAERRKETAKPAKKVAAKKEAAPKKEVPRRSRLAS